MDNLRKALTFLFAAIGLVIFYWVILVKVEVMAEQTKAHVEKTSAVLGWEDYLYDRALDAAAQEHKSFKANTRGKK